MTVLRESPWYQEILEEGLKQGLQQGREQGILQGRREDTLHLLRTRFYLPTETEAELTDRLAQIESAACSRLWSSPPPRSRVWPPLPSGWTRKHPCYRVAERVIILLRNGKF